MSTVEVHSFMIAHCIWIAAYQTKWLGFFAEANRLCNLVQFVGGRIQIRACASKKKSNSVWITFMKLVHEIFWRYRRFTVTVFTYRKGFPIPPKIADNWPKFYHVIGEITSATTA